jgi:hypothetical protein
VPGDTFLEGLWIVPSIRKALVLMALLSWPATCYNADSTK